MKTRSLTLFIFLMLLTFVMYNCKNNGADTLQPSNTELSDQIDNLGLGEVTLNESQDLKVTPGSVEISAKTKEVNSALESIAGAGTVPSSVTTAATDISTTLSTADIKTLTGITTSNAIDKSTLASAQIKALLSKAAGDTKLQNYLPKLSLPVIAPMTKPEKVSSGTSNQRTQATTGGLDECVERANEKFNKTKDRLDDDRARELADITDRYNKDLEKIAKNLEKCAGENTAEKFEKLRQVGIAIANEALKALEKAKPFLKNEQYELLKALINLQLLDYLDKVNKLEADKTASCTVQAQIATAYAVSVRDANISKVDAAFNKAMEKAVELRDKMIANCHNQGSGN